MSTYRSLTIMACALLLLLPQAAGASAGEKVPAGGWQVIYPHRTQPLLHGGSGVGVDRQHNVYVADLTAGRETKFTPGGRVLSSWPLLHPDLVRIWQPSRLAVNGAGISYVLLNGILRYSPAGRLLSRWSAGQHPVSLAVGGSGNVFLLSFQPAAGGTGGGARVDKISPSGKILATWYTPPLTPKAVAPDGLAVDPRGNVYVTVATDNQCYKACIPRTSVLYRFSPAGVITWTLHPSHITFGPVAAVDGAGTMYLLPHDVNYETMSLERLSPGGKVLSLRSRLGGQQLGDTLHIALDGGRFYLTDTHQFDLPPWAASGVVRVLDRSEVQRARWGSFSGAQSVPFNLGLAIGPDGNVYATGGPGSVAYMVISPSGQVLRRVGSTGPNGEIGDARSIRVDSHGTVYVVDGAGGRLATFSPGGKLLARWTLPGGYTLGPDDLAIGRSGNIYVTAPSVILKISPKGKLLARIGSAGSGPGQFSAPSGIALDRHGNIFVADTGNNRIQELDQHGAPLQQWGNLKQLDRPRRLALDSAGNVYVIDVTHDAIQEFSPQGKLQAVLGQTGIQPGQLLGPTGLAFDAHGDLYVLDYGNDRIQRLGAR